MDNLVSSSTLSCLDKREYCSTSQAANIIGVSHGTIRLWVESAVLHAWKTAGGHRRISLASVHKMVDRRHKELSNAPAPLLVPIACTKKKILIVDDDRVTLRLCEAEIKAWGMPVEVLKASNGFDALIMIGEYKPDMLISDLNVPGLDGFRMIRALRRHPAYAHMTIILISGLEQSTLTSMHLPREIPILSKPASFSRLRGLIEAAFQ